MGAPTGEAGEPDVEVCDCGKPLLSVSLAHYLACGEDPAMTREEADNLIAALAHVFALGD